MFECRTDADRFQQEVASVIRLRTAWTRGRLLEMVMEAERDLFLACDHYERSQQRRGYRNGYRRRYLETVSGSLRIRVPRVRDSEVPFRPRTIEAYQRRTRLIDRMITEWVACGMSTREIRGVLKEVFGAYVSAGTVSNIVAELDADVRAFHNRSLRPGYRFVYFDGKHCYTSYLRKRRGRGKKKPAVLLLAWGVRHDGVEELVDFRVADSESEQSWTDFMTDLWERGLKPRGPLGQKLEMIVTDGDKGLRAALWMVYPRVPKQLCAFHKIQNITDHLEDSDLREAILSEAAAIYDGLKTPRQARRRLTAWKECWEELEPKAVRCFAYEFEDTLTYLNAPAQWQHRLKTSNPIERVIQELSKKIEQVGIFPTAQSLERSTYLVWRKLQRQGYGRTVRQNPLAVFTPNS